jgi:hypothetical protein
MHVHILLRCAVMCIQRNCSGQVPRRSSLTKHLKEEVTVSEENSEEEHARGHKQ